MERNPLAKGGVHAAIVNNWIFNPGRRTIHHALNEGEWEGHAPVTSRLPIDLRIISGALEGSGRIIDSEKEVGGYPERPATHAPFEVERWDLATMQRKP